MSGIYSVINEWWRYQIDLREIDLVVISELDLLTKVDVDSLPAWQDCQVLIKNIDGLCSDATQGLIKALLTEDLKALRCTLPGGISMLYTPSSRGFWTVLIDLSQCDIETYGKMALQGVLAQFLSALPDLVMDLHFVTEGLDYSGFTLAIPKHVRGVFLDAGVPSPDQVRLILSFMTALAESPHTQFELKLMFRHSFVSASGEPLKAILKAIPRPIPSVYIIGLPLPLPLIDERVGDYLAYLSPGLRSLKIDDRCLFQFHETEGWITPLGRLPKCLQSFSASLPVGLTTGDYRTLLAPLPKTTTRIDPIGCNLGSTLSIYAALPPQIKTTTMHLSPLLRDNVKMIKALPGQVKVVELEQVWDLASYVPGEPIKYDQFGHFKLLLNKMKEKNIHPLVSFIYEKKYCEDPSFHHFFPWQKRREWVRLGLAASDKRKSRAPQSALLVKDAVKAADAGAGAGFGGAPEK